MASKWDPTPFEPYYPPWLTPGYYDGMPTSDWERIRILLPSTKENPSQNQVGGDHYKKLKIQPSAYIFANNLGWAEGNAIAYITRWKDKGGVQDLEKAIHTLQLLIEDNKNGAD